MGRGFSLNISHFGLYCTDVERMVDFYGRMFGFVVSDRGESSAGPSIVYLWGFIEQKVRATPGFKMRTEWQAEIKQKIAGAATQM